MFNVAVAIVNACFITATHTLTQDARLYTHPKAVLLRIISNFSFTDDPSAIIAFFGSY
jgi:hypothetical protein